MTRLSTQILEHSMRLLIPNRDRNGDIVDTSNCVTDLKYLIGRRIGGCLELSARGIYVYSKGTLIEEDVAVIDINFTKEHLPGICSVVMHYTVALRETLHQESIALYVNGRLILLSDDDDEAAMVGGGRKPIPGSPFSGSNAK